MDLVASARELAFRAHAHQRDQAGRPYVEHLERVAKAVEGDRDAEIVAWLHDLLEDQPAYGHELLRFPQPIQYAVQLLTYSRGMDRAAYYARIRDDRLARAVKIADVQDNADESRLSQLAPATASRLRGKYAKALASLS